MTRELERALAFVRARRDRARGDARRTQGGASSPAAVDVRLSNLERQLDEIKGRINGLLFVLAGAVATQVMLKLFA